jgi:hypothetical protein
MRLPDYQSLMRVVPLFSMGQIRKISLFALACFIIMQAVLAFANDTTANLAAGGLVFTRSSEIEMQSEDLFISGKEIRVHYRFLNHSDKDIVTQIAFPMPDIPFGDADFNYEIPSADPNNILAFTTVVDGQPVSARLEQKAFVGDVDRTDELRNLGVPIAPSANQPLEHLSPKTWDELVRLGLAEIEDNGKDAREIYPRWTLKTTYYWEQRFPAHSLVVIDHRYLPSVGGTVEMPIADLLGQPGLGRYCIDKGTLSALNNPPNAVWEQHFLEYILVTGANWSGPIGDFRLVVDKGSPKNVVSFCGQGVKKISPTEFELRARQFVPSSNLNVLILVQAHPEPNDDSPSSVPASPDIAEMSCDQLWYRRNSIFKSAGYCFHSPQGIRVFGNAGCQFDNTDELPFSDQDRQAIDTLQRWERTRRCER